MVFIGCQQEDSFDESTDYGVYLSLPPNVNFDELTESDEEILFQTFSRLDIIENADGLFEIQQMCGEDINVSEELFNYFQRIIDNTNQQILSGVHYRRNGVLTRQESTGNSNTDCVARSIAYATGQSYDSVNTWITGKYGNKGVPANKFHEVMEHFSPDGEKVPLSTFNATDIKPENKKDYVIVINNSHAVNVTMKDGPAIMYHDPQIDKLGFCETSDVTHAYKVR